MTQFAESIQDPFGETRSPWWRRVWRRERAESPPRRYLVPATMLGGIAGLSLPSVHGYIEGAVIFGLVTMLPPALVGMWWKQRRRRASEELLVLPVAERTESGQA